MSDCDGHDPNCQSLKRACSAIPGSSDRDTHLTWDCTCRRSLVGRGRCDWARTHAASIFTFTNGATMRGSAPLTSSQDPARGTLNSRTWQRAATARGGHAGLLKTTRLSVHVMLLRDVVFALNRASSDEIAARSVGSS